MLSKRPILKLPKSGVDKLLEALTFTCIAIGWIVIAISYKSLPDIIPTHYDLKGNIDHHGAKAIIWLLPLIFTAVVTGIFYLNKFPHYFSYMVEITKENAEQQYVAATRLIRIIQLGVAIIFLILVTDIIISSVTGESFLGAWFVPATLLFFTITVAVGMLRKNNGVSVNRS